MKEDIDPVNSGKSISILNKTRIEEGPVLAVVDGSTASYKAVWWAANYADHAEEELRIVCTIDPSKLGAASSEEDQSNIDKDSLIDTAKKILAKAKTIALGQGVTAQTFLLRGDPRKTLINISRNYHLMVMGNRATNGLVAKLMGSTSYSVAALSYCPIVVVPYKNDEKETLHLRNTMSHIVVGVDDSEAGDRILNIAAHFANSWDAELTVVSAIPQFAVSCGQLPIVLTDEEMEHIFDVHSKELEEKILPMTMCSIYWRIHNFTVEISKRY